ncbi:MAG TPA: hypothetical protein VNA13_05305 [Xanthomonadales bacterium]|nr:hypothetical protein [Xanthomonadales bacterium]
MKITLLILFLIAVIAGGLYVNKNPVKMDLSTLMPFSQITPTVKKKSVGTGEKNLTNPPQACSGTQLPAATEGPYYKSGTPLRKKIDDGISGNKLTLQGYVLDTNCRPVANAWLDFWQADGTGKYDNTGFKLRGHQFTDAEGKYALETIIPGEYPGRTPHVHAKVKARENSPELTVQLFIPGVEKNQNDGIFNKELLMNITESQNGKAGTFNFIINTNL